jgi:hypothetical protein
MSEAKTGTPCPSDPRRCRGVRETHDNVRRLGTGRCAGIPKGRHITPPWSSARRNGLSSSAGRNRHLLSTRANKLGADLSGAALSPTKSPAGNHTTVGSPSTRVGKRPQISLKSVPLPTRRYPPASTWWNAHAPEDGEQPLRYRHQPTVVAPDLSNSAPQCQNHGVIPGPYCLHLQSSDRTAHCHQRQHSSARYPDIALLLPGTGLQNQGHLQLP